MSFRKIVLVLVASILLLTTLLFLNWLHDFVVTGVLLHEFGHQAGLSHCHHDYCIMNVGKDPISLIKKAIHFNYCSHCFEEVYEYIREETRGQIAKGILVVYNYNGNPRRVSDLFSEFMRSKFNLNVDFIIVVMKDVPDNFISKEGYILPEYLVPKLSETYNLNNYFIIAQINDPLIKTQLWGRTLRYQGKTVIYAFPPTLPLVLDQDQNSPRPLP